MTVTKIVLVVACCTMVGAAAMAAQQHQWKSPARATAALRPSLVEPRAVTGPSNGIYCPDLSEGAVGVHDLGWIPTGLNVEINVQSYSDNGFDPVAGIVVASLGAPGANSIKTTTFYDNDSGGSKDARITFVTPQAGTYVLFVADNGGATPGCYRYQAYIR